MTHGLLLPFDNDSPEFEAITAALGYATKTQDRLAFGDVDAAMEDIGKVVSILVDA